MASETKKRDSGNATWCVRKHSTAGRKDVEITLAKLQRANKMSVDRMKRRKGKLSVHNLLLGGRMHTVETLQKLERQRVGKGYVKVDEPTVDEANQLVANVLAAEEHIETEILPQLPKGRKYDSLRNELARLSDRARGIRQNVANTGIIYYNAKNVPVQSIDVLRSANKDLRDLIKDVDKTASFMMKQEQIGVDCPRCTYDLIGIDTKPSGSKPVKRRVVKRKKKSAWRWPWEPKPKSRRRK